MEKIVAGDPETRSANVVAENLERMEALFPEAFSEGKVDFDVLRQILGSVVDESDEGYGLNWHGKRRARQHALTPTTGTLRPCPEESVDWDSTQNLMIEGENLEVLKLLQKSYSGKVKLIYIDPPYNTGNNLIYPNDYKDGIGAYLQLTGQVDGKEGIQTSNPVGGGRFHTKWLSMIYPRLKLARTLLTKDGVMICTIDDNEVAQLGVVLKEVFEEGTYKHVCVPIIHNPRGVQGKNFSYVHEYGYFVYPNGIKAIGDKAIDPDEISWSQFRNWGGESLRADAKNCFYPVLVKGGKIIGFGEVCSDDFHPAQTECRNNVAYVYPIDNTGVERKWRYARQSADAIRHLLRAKMTKQGYQIEIGKDFGLHKTVWADSRYDANQYGTKIVGDLLPNAPFTFPKSLWAVYDSVVAATGKDKDAIVLDFFAGSGTTAHAVMELNKETGGRRRFILVQLPELISDNNDFQTISEITKERLRRAGDNIWNEKPDCAVDCGFRVFKLDTSNIRQWDTHPDDLDADLFSNLDHVRPNRTEQDILYELLLKLGLDLCVPIDDRTIAGKSVHSVAAGTLIACLDESISRDDAEPLASGIADWADALDPAGGGGGGALWCSVTMRSPTTSQRQTLPRF